jgi:deoxycytidylate deaminase
MNFDWGELAFGSKKPVNSLKATFIAAPREISSIRFTQLVKEYLPKGNIVLGLAKEDYVLGFEGQPQFCTLKAAAVEGIISKVAESPSPNKIYTLNYFQRDLNYLLEKLSFKRAVFINGSWKYAFHNLPQYFTLVNRDIPYQLISPFTDEKEAKAYEKLTTKQLPTLRGTSSQSLMSAAEMMELAGEAAKHSYDYSFQTGTALGKKKAAGYQILAISFNRVVPYQTYVMHYGASRETNFSPPNDLNHYDATHAEVELVIKAQKQQLDLRSTTLFINLLPCPTCARMLSRTDIEEFVYSQDHSGGYAVKMLEMSGKKVRRLVP